MSVERTRTGWAMARTTRLAFACALLIAIALALAGCSSSAEESNVPTNELPAEGQAAMYEFYTDS